MSGAVVGLTLSSDTRTTAGILLLTIVAVEYDGVANVLARDGIWAAAILFPAGFFLSSATRGTTQPNRLIVLVYARGRCAHRRRPRPRHRPPHRMTPVPASL
jgi:hypothetical protein